MTSTKKVIKISKSDFLFGDAIKFSINLDW